MGQRQLAQCDRRRLPVPSSTRPRTLGRARGARCELTPLQGPRPAPTFWCRPWYMSLEIRRDSRTRCRPRRARTCCSSSSTSSITALRKFITGRDRTRVSRGAASWPTTGCDKTARPRWARSAPRSSLGSCTTCGWEADCESVSRRKVARTRSAELGDRHARSCSVKEVVSGRPDRHRVTVPVVTVDHDAVNERVLFDGCAPHAPTCFYC